MLGAVGSFFWIALAVGSYFWMSQFQNRIASTSCQTIAASTDSAQSSNASGAMPAA